MIGMPLIFSIPPMRILNTKVICTHCPLKALCKTVLAMRADISYKESSLALVYRNKFSDSDSYDSIISQWDWTLLYT